MLKTSVKPDRCPWCRSNLVAEIIHEINSLTPTVERDLNDRKAVLGVNMEDAENPSWQCMDCGAQIYSRIQARHHGRKTADVTTLLERSTAAGMDSRHKDA